MIRGLTGVKLGMNRYFTSEGCAIPVTVINIKPHRVVQIKSVEKDGYSAVQVTSGVKKVRHITKSEFGHFSKSNIDIGNGLWEFSYDNGKKLSVGEIITISLFNNIQLVDVTGISKGKGFCGTVKRWNFKSQDASHGNSLSHRAPGSIGQNQTPGRVFKGKKMAGHLGDMKVTIQNLDVVFVDTKDDVLFVKGSIPGKISDVVYVQISKKFNFVKKNV